MADRGEGSVTVWIGHLKAGDPLAAHHLCDRYFGRMVGLARRRLRGGRPVGAAEDEEDVALSAFQSLCQGAAQGQFARLDDRDDLWQLLVVITSRKAIDQVKRGCRQKRGGGRVLDESALVGDRASERAGGLDAIAGDETDPAFLAMAAEECQRLLDALGDDTLRQIALLRMDGETGEAIAGRLGCSLRTVANKLKLIRMKWERDAP
ncbi:ECF sigma factor [Aquisphaera giovannonii]|uniref:ECF sigma factor n=1 Tax=Aquisphaera giovannonii TaxID=406548 RepID=A0A5B9VVB4_9BACT|nr:ECF-type sigma factor [Aquisphaera giovannonii]QEH32293.1 ECF sigma factor [Aquisphaera giovannonii]